jgi:dihydropteroate synthase
MNIYRLDNIKEPKDLLNDLGVEGGGVEIMSKKMELLTFYISNLPTPAVNILKQDALSIGADLAVPSGVILCAESSYDCILMGTLKHIKILSKKELAQPFGLKKIAKELKKHISTTKEYESKIMGVINANSDSFFKNSRFLADDAILEIENMIADGAKIIDIGAVSSRPNALVVSCDEEMRRVVDICDTIKKRELYKKAIFSIDSTTYEVIEYALKSGFTIINDVSGLANYDVIKLAVKYSAKLVVMHIQGTPQTMQDNPSYQNLIAEVSDFFEDRVDICLELGMSRDDIILDVGIGFGKSLAHNITLIKNISHFKKFGCEMLIGASRKSMIDSIMPTKVEDRLLGTIALHLKALDGGVSIIRCHDVLEHNRAISVWSAIK